MKYFHMVINKKALVAAFLVFVPAVIFSDFWRAIRLVGLSSDQAYSQRRESQAFRGIPMDYAKLRIQSLLGDQKTISFGPNAVSNDFFIQRLTEGLYPLLFDQKAINKLDFVHRDHFSPSLGEKIFETRNQLIFYLTPPFQLNEKSSDATLLDYEFHFPSFLITMLSILGFGCGLQGLMILSKVKINLPFLFQSVLLSSVIIALATMLATWIQFPIPWKAVTVFGVLLFVISLLYWARKPAGVALFDEIQKFKTHPENGLFLIIMFGFALVVFQLPISHWDGRSIWLFNAHKIFHHGMMTHFDATNPDAQWSHTGYPLLLPGWLAYFSGLFSTFHERLAASGLTVLFTSLLGLLWIETRKAIGRFEGALFSFAVFFSISSLSAGSYADGFLLLFLLLAFLWLFSESNSLMAWSAILGASLCKQEGFVLASILYVFAIRQTGLRAVKYGLLFFPIIIHLLFGKLLGLKGAFDQVNLELVLSHFGERAWIILQGFVSMLWKSPIAVQAALCVIIVVLVRLMQRNQNLSSNLALWFALLSMTFIFSVYMITPQDLQWHLRNSIDRLIFHPAAFAILGSLLYLKRASKVST